MLALTRTTAAASRNRNGEAARTTSLLPRVADAHDAAGRWLTRVIEPVFNVAARIWMGKIFLDSGLARVANWDKQPFLFETEYKLGVLSPKAWAIVTTGAELILPVLLFIGLLTRLPALGLLVMTAFIHFVVGFANDDYLAPYHYVWMLAFGYLVIRGGGSLSVDGLLAHGRAPMAG
jgi:uncharacterized membrane protein YphA (DoxX/SURF4 family)